MSSFANDIIEICKDILYFCLSNQLYISDKITVTKSSVFFCIDEELKYVNFSNDFGPFNLSCLYKYCVKVNKLLEYFKGKKKVVHYTSYDPKKRVNAAFLIGSYAILYLKLWPFEVEHLLSTIGPYKKYNDALKKSNLNVTISLRDCLQAISKASYFNLFNFDDFNLTEYDLFGSSKFGGLNWIVPQKLLGFMGPNPYSQPLIFYLEYFQHNNVKTIIRLNNKLYDSTVFTQNGIQHFDLYFDDGSVPPQHVVVSFFEIVETTPAAVAIHCRAGLGRTGTLICLYLMKHYAMSAKESIAWTRICRPGSVVSRQQLWLEAVEEDTNKLGNNYRLQYYGDADKIRRHKFGIYSKAIRTKANTKKIPNENFHYKKKIIKGIRSKFY